MATQQQIGEAIIKLRKIKGLSQEALAAEAGIDRRYMSDIEQGNNKAIEKRRSGTVTYWSGSLLGRFSVWTDDTGKMLSRTIYLFIATIRTHASNHTYPLWKKGILSTGLFKNT